MSADEDPHKSLRDDVSLLGEMLGATLRAREGHAVFETVEQVLGKLEEGDRRPAWAIIGMFDGLRRHDPGPVVKQASQPRDAAWQEAERLYFGMSVGTGTVDFSARMRVQAAVKAAGVTELYWHDRRSAIAGIAAAIRAGTLDPGTA